MDIGTEEESFILEPNELPAPVQIPAPSEAPAESPAEAPVEPEKVPA